MAQSNGLRGVCAGVLMLVSALGVAEVPARSLTDLDAVHQAALQRTLVMRVAKAHIQAGTHQAQGEKALQASIDQYEMGLAQLEENAPNSQINQRIAKLKLLWQEYRGLAQSRTDRASVLALLEQSNNLLFQNDALVREWQTRLPQRQGERSELALQQGMLSERMGLFYEAHNYGVQESWVLEEMRYSMRAYDKGMSELRTLALQDGDTRALTQLDSQWHVARDGLQQMNVGKAVEMTVAMESLYQQSNELGALYREDDRMGLSGASLASMVPVD